MGKKSKYQDIKTCARCKEEFSWYECPSSYCRKCSREIGYESRERISNQLYNGDTSKFDRNKNLLKLYGISLFQFDEMLSGQGGLCFICNIASEKWIVDHDHACCPGKKTCGQCVRWILCYKCNAMLTQDDPKILRRAAELLEERQQIV